jgi:hypothetical protein
MALTAEQQQQVVRRFSQVAYASSPATSDTPGILAAVQAVDVLVEQAQDQWLALLPAPFRDESTDQQKAQLIAAVIDGRTGMA